MIKAYVLVMLSALMLPGLLLEPAEPLPVVSGCAGITPIPRDPVLREAGHKACFHFIAMRSCGNPDGDWDEISPGQVRCLTKHGRSTGQVIRILP
jgi:hypothetical protein